MRSKYFSYLFTTIGQQDVIFAGGDGSFALLLVTEIETGLFVLHIILEFVLGWLLVATVWVSSSWCWISVVASVVVAVSLSGDAVLVGWSLLVAIGALAVKVVKVLSGWNSVWGCWWAVVGIGLLSWSAIVGIGLLSWSSVVRAWLLGWSSVLASWLLLLLNRENLLSHQVTDFIDLTYLRCCVLVARLLSWCSIVLSWLLSGVVGSSLTLRRCAILARWSREASSLWWQVRAARCWRLSEDHRHQESRDNCKLFGKWKES